MKACMLTTWCWAATSRERAPSPPQLADFHCRHLPCWHAHRPREHPAHEFEEVRLAGGAGGGPALRVCLNVLLAMDDRVELVGI